MTLEKIHYGYQGIEHCRMGVSTSLWWLGVSTHVERFVQACPLCQKSTPPCREPMISIPLPSHPWEGITSDL